MQKLSVIQANHITAARYDYSLTEKRLIYHVIFHLQDTFREALQEGVIPPFDRELDIFIPENQMKMADANDNHYRDYKKAVEALRIKSFGFDSPTGWVSTGFLARGKYIKGQGLEMSVSRDVLPFLYDLARGFTAMSAMAALTLQSKFSQRFYEWCCRWKDTGWFDFTPLALNDILGLKLSTKDLRLKVIETAEKEIKSFFDNQQSDVWFSFSEKRGGRGRGGKVLEWNFKVHSNKTKPSKEKKLGGNNEFISTNALLQKTFGGQNKLIDKILEFLSQDRERLQDFTDRMKAVDFDCIENPAGYIRSILQKRYGFEPPKSKVEKPKRERNSPQRISDILAKK